MNPNGKTCPAISRMTVQPESIMQSHRIFCYIERNYETEAINGTWHWADYQRHFLRYKIILFYLHVVKVLAGRKNSYFVAVSFINAEFLLS